jgi:hypothetical protein
LPRPPLFFAARFGRAGFARALGDEGDDFLALLEPRLPATRAFRLTSSALPGHAMRAGDAEAARGAVLGKALEDLQGTSGLVLILASLQ